MKKIQKKATKDGKSKEWNSGFIDVPGTKSCGQSMIFFFVSDFPVAHGAADVVGGIAGPRTWRKRSTSSSHANFPFSCFTSSNSLSRSCCFLSEREGCPRTDPRAGSSSRN